VQQQVLTGVVFIVLFGIGHCIPIAVAGSSTALVRRFLANNSWQQGSTWFRRMAGVGIGVLGLYFISYPVLGVLL
jgi:cytochrome c-type biogenesis protein